MYHFLSHQEVCELGNLAGEILCFAMDGSVFFWEWMNPPSLI